MPTATELEAAFYRAKETILDAGLNRRQARGIMERLAKKELADPDRWEKFLATLPEPAQTNGHKPQEQPVNPNPVPGQTAEIWSPAALVAAEIPDPEAFIGEDVASRGTISVFAGRRGAGKTYLLLRLAASIALGGSFGDLQCRSGRVLFLSQEMGKGAIRKRIRRLFSLEEQLELDQKLDVICKLPWKLDSDDALAPLLIVLSAQSWDVIIVDALRDVKGKLRENDNDDMAEGFVRFRDQVCERFNLSGLVNHHKGKPSQDGTDRGSRGASTIEDIAADVLYVSKSDSGRHIDFEKTRDGGTEGKRFDFTIGNDQDDPERILLDVTESQSTNEVSFELNKLYDTLLKDGSSLFSMEDICRLMSWSKRTAERYVKLAREAARLVNTTTRPAKALYRLVLLAD